MFVCVLVRAYGVCRVFVAGLDRAIVVIRGRDTVLARGIVVGIVERIRRSRQCRNTIGPTLTRPSEMDP